MLPRKEFNLLAPLYSKPPQAIFARRDILGGVGDRTIDVHIRKLREKIGVHITVKGIGYKY